MRDSPLLGITGKQDSVGWNGIVKTYRLMDWRTRDVPSGVEFFWTEEDFAEPEGDSAKEYVSGKGGVSD